MPDVRPATAHPPADDAVLDWVRAAAVGYPFGPRRGLDLVRPGTEAAVTTATFERDELGARALFTVGGAGGIAAATALAPKPMETEHFEIQTAALANVLCPPEQPDRLAWIRRLLREAVQAAGDHGVELLILRIDVDDVDALAAAQDAGFLVHETTMTWLLDSTRAAEVPPHRPTVTCDVVEGDVTGVLDAALVDRFARHTARWDLSHLRADPRLPPEAVMRFYAAMVANIVAGDWCDRMYVARHEGRIIGIASEVTDRLVLDASGTDVRNAEWFVVMEEGLGGGQAMATTAARNPHPGGTVHSWETQARNLATIRCTENTRISRAVRASYTLHAWPRWTGDA